MAYESYNAYLSTIKSTQVEYYKDYFQEIVDDQFEDASTIKTVKHNTVDVVVRIVGVYTKESLNKRIEGLQKIIFKNSDYVVNVGDIFEVEHHIQNHVLCRSVLIHWIL